MNLDVVRRTRSVLSRVREASCRLRVVGMNFGSGKSWVGLPFWRSFDALNGEHFTDRTELSFADNSLPFLFSSHFIEHLSVSEAEHFFEETFRILKPGGKFRIICPDISKLANWVSFGHNPLTISRPGGWGSSDLELNVENIFLHFACHYELYSEDQNGSVVFRGPPKLSVETARDIAALPTSEIWPAVEKYVPELCKPAIQHRSCWCKGTLREAAEGAGFYFEESDYGLARSKTWRFFDFTHGRREISLYAELLKPSSSK